tara:strand:- start:698 stop:1810 length:1113 start_codon:yes stop_codon:yes gene_type:complete
MRTREIKFNNSINKYSLFLGHNILNILPKKIDLICPGTKKVALIMDRNVPSKFKKIIKKNLRSYNIYFLTITSNERNKSLKSVNILLDRLLFLNFNRSDLIISIGGGIVGDVVGFTASIFKRGINFINIPTTLLAQVDSAVGGKTGVNSKFGKNLIGSFYQPKLVIIDTSFLESLPKKEIICGFAEILKHSIIKDKKLFQWLKKNSKFILAKRKKELKYAIEKSCKIKMLIVNKDVNEKKIRMILNFGHTFAHAIEVKNNYSKKLTHGEAVLSGMILAIKLSIFKKICKNQTLKEVKDIYDENGLSYTYKNYLDYKSVLKLIPFLKNDKKNDDDKINFILLKKIGATTLPNKNKISINNIKKYFKIISQY